MCQKETQIPRVTNFGGELCEHFGDNCGDFGKMDEFLEKQRRTFNKTNDPPRFATICCKFFGDSYCTNTLWGECRTRLECFLTYQPRDNDTYI